MIVRYNQVVSLNSFFKKYSEVSHILLKFNFFYSLNYKIFSLNNFFRTKKVYLNFIYFYFSVFFNRYVSKDVFINKYLYLNFNMFKQFFFFLYYLKSNNESVVIFDSSNFKFISKCVFNKIDSNNLDIVFNYFLTFKKIKTFIFLNRKLFNYFKVNYSDLDIVILYFPFTDDSISRYFFNNLLYKIF